MPFAKDSLIMYNTPMNTVIITSLRNNLAAIIDFFEDLTASRNQKYKDDIKKSREEIKRGHVHTIEEVFGKSY